MNLAFIAQVIIGIIIIFAAGMIQGITSFGFSLLAVPLLSIFLPFKIVVPMLIIYSLFLNSIILYNVRKYINLKRIYILIIAGIVGTFFGTYALESLDDSILKIIVGSIVTLSAIAFIKGYRMPVKNEKLSYLPVGLLSGLLNGSASLSGPPIILFLKNQETEKQIFRASLTSYFWALNISTIPIQIARGLIDKTVITYTIYLLPGLVLGVLIGIKLGNKVDESLFKKLTLGLILFMGLLSIISGLR